MSELWQQTSIVAFPRRVPGRRNLNKVPYVEMFNGRLQGVVSSGSSATRVYCSWIEAGTGDYYCSTNNNRRCGGLRGGGCKHIDSMISQAIFHFGGDELAAFLGVEGEPGSFNSAWKLKAGLGGSERKEQASAVFARFLNYLRYMDLPPSAQPLPELAFFITG